MFQGIDKNLIPRLKNAYDQNVEGLETVWNEISRKINISRDVKLFSSAQNTIILSVNHLEINNDVESEVTVEVTPVEDKGTAEMQ